MVDAYYNCFHDLLDTLGPEFETIQNNFCICYLLLVLCQDYFNPVKPQGVSKCDQSGETGCDQFTQHKKVKEWSMHPYKAHHDVEAEQQKHPGKCIIIFPRPILLMSVLSRKNVINLWLIKK